MPKKIFIGGLSFQTSSEDLRNSLQKIAKPSSIRLVKSEDGRTQSAYVEMATDEEADMAIRTLNGSTVNGQAIVAREDDGSRKAPEQ